MLEREHLDRIPVRELPSRVGLREVLIAAQGDPDGDEEDETESE